MKRPPTSWTNDQKAALVEQIVLQQLTLSEACQRHSLSQQELRSWVRIFRQSARQALDRRLRDTLSLQGFDLGDLDLEETASDCSPSNHLAQLLSQLQSEGKDATLVFTLEGRQAHIWCRRGEVIDAECGRSRGATAFYKVACTARGKVALHPLYGTRERTVHSATRNLLATCHERMTKRQALLAALGGPHTILQCRETIDSDWAQLDSGDQALLALCNGARPIDIVLLDHPSSDLSTLKSLGRLRKAGWLRRARTEPPLSISSVSSSLQTNTLPTTSFLPIATSLPARKTDHRSTWITGAAIVSSVLGALTAVGYVQLESELNGQASSASTPALQCPGSMALLRGGEFPMGARAPEGMPVSGPVHRVELTSFCMDRFEATVADYAECIDAGVCTVPSAQTQLASTTVSGISLSKRLHGTQCNYGQLGREQHPINCVSQHQAARYCAFRGARLATEAEWEYAARGSEGRRYPWGNTPPSASHLNACGDECKRWHSSVGLHGEVDTPLYPHDDGFSGTAPVGSFDDGATPEGIFDLAGNVFEWTAGGLYPYSLTPRRNPVGPTTSGFHVIKGGSFKTSTPSLAFASSRFELPASKQSASVGFRCVVPLPRQSQ